MLDGRKRLALPRSVILSMGVLLLVGCSWPYWPFSGIVYTSGWYNDGDKNVPCYWVGTVRTDLVGDGVHGAQASSIVAAGGKTYVAGTYGNGHRDRACIWVNNVLGSLSDDGMHSSAASDICVADGAVYVSGNWDDGEKSTACYWTDGERVDLPAGAGRSGYASAICVSAGTVYVSGRLDDSATGDTTPCYWKDQERVELPITRLNELPLHGAATAICVSGGKVYTAGTNPPDLSCYWVGQHYTGGVDGNTADGSNCWFIGIGSVDVVNDVIYLGGTAQGPGPDHGCVAYLAGNRVTVLEVSGPGSEAGGGPMCVHSGDVYTAGYFYRYDPPSPFKLYYWFNDLRVRLPYPDQSGGPAGVTSIFVD